MKCKKRKEIVTEKKKNAREEEELDILCSYNFSNTQNQDPINSSPLITGNETLKSNISLAHAHYKT